MSSKILGKLLELLQQMPQKSQKAVLADIDFEHKTPRENFKTIVDKMSSLAKNQSMRDKLEIYRELQPTDEEVLEVFGSSKAEPPPLNFNDDQLEFIRKSVYRNRDGEFRLIPSQVMSADAMPLEGLKADEDIIGARLTVSRISQSGAEEEFNGLKELKKQSYEGPYDGIYKSLAPNLRRIEIISSFDRDDPSGFFTRNGQMFRNVCAQMNSVDYDFVNKKSLRRAMFLMYIVAGANVEDWFTLYKLVHFMVRVPNSATGYILYLNDFDAGGNGKSKFVSVLQRMFGESFTSFAVQQLRFTINLLGKRLVSISEYEENEASKPLQGLLKAMTGRDNFQYEGKGTNPIVADSYQNFVISSNKYIHFEDSGIKRRLQNFHCSNLLHMMLNKYCHTHAYLDTLFGSVYDSEAVKVQKEMANSLLHYILKDENKYKISIRPQGIVLGSLKNPVLRALFAPKLNLEGCIRDYGDGCAIDLFRLSSDAKPEQYNYAANVIQQWLEGLNMSPTRDCMTLVSSAPKELMIKRVKEQLTQLDDTSNRLREKSVVRLQLGRILDDFDVEEMFEEFLGDACREYRIPVAKECGYMKVGE